MRFIVFFIIILALKKMNLFAIYKKCNKLIPTVLDGQRTIRMPSYSLITEERLWTSEKIALVKKQ